MTANCVPIDSGHLYWPAAPLSGDKVCFQLFVGRDCSDAGTFASTGECGGRVSLCGTESAPGDHRVHQQSQLTPARPRDSGLQLAASGCSRAAYYDIATGIVTLLNHYALSRTVSLRIEVRAHPHSSTAVSKRRVI